MVFSIILKVYLQKILKYVELYLPPDWEAEWEKADREREEEEDPQWAAQISGHREHEPGKTQVGGEMSMFHDRSETHITFKEWEELIDVSKR